MNGGYSIYTPFRWSMCTVVWYLPPFNIRSPLYSRIINHTFRDKKEPRSIPIFRMETTRSKKYILSKCVLVICIRTYIYRKLKVLPLSIRGILPSVLALWKKL
jgi:hypothetical protein